MPTASFTRSFHASATRLEAIAQRPGSGYAPLTLTATRGPDHLDHAFTTLDGAPVDVRSLAKTVTVLTLGAAVQRSAGPLGPAPVDLDRPIGPLIAVALPTLTLRQPGRWEHVTLRHLLAHTTGHDHGFLFRTDAAHLIDRVDTHPDTLLRHITDQPIPHAPGTHFAYSNAGYHLVAALIAELSGRSLADWTDELLLEPLGIPRPAWSWRQYGRYPAAATGIRLTAPHLHRIADLLRHGGRHDGHSLVDPRWTAAMTSPQATPVQPPPDPDDPLPRAAYGLGLWLGHPTDPTRPTTRRLSGEGADGQYLVIDPATDTAITLTADRCDQATTAAVRAALSPLLTPTP